MFPECNPYALEVRSLLQSNDSIRAQAVFDVEGVPTVVFVGDDESPLSEDDLNRIRQKVWNQNLASVVIEMAGPVARTFPARKLPDFEEIRLNEARPDGPFSALGRGSFEYRATLPGLVRCRSACRPEAA